MSLNPSNNDEIVLLERVLLRLACADTDEQLQAAVSKFLAPVLLKIVSPEESVRLKVMEVLTHINKRLKTRPMIQIPVQDILNQYINTESSFAMNFAIIYITMGFPRLSTELKTQLTPELLVALAGKPDVHQDKILSLIVPLLGDIKLSEDSEAKKRILRLLEQNSVKMQLISYLQDVLLFPYGVTQESEMPAGMSAYTFRRISGNQWRTEELERYKTGLVKFLSSDLLKPEDVVVPLIVASADTRFSVATPAIAELSKICISIDWTDGSLSAPLYSLFSGNGVKITDKKSSPCNVRVRQKLLQYLLKCRGRGIDTIKGIQVIFEALFGEQTNQRCKVLALQFSENLIKDGNPELIRKVSKVIATGIGKVVNASPPEPIDVQNAAYSAMSILVCVCPEIVRKDLQLVVTYFTTLDKAQSEIQASLREALISMAPAFSWSHETTTDTSDQGNHNLLLALIAQHSESQSTIVQSVCVVFLTTCFPPQQVTARYLLLLIAGSKPSLRESIFTHLYGSPKKDNIDYGRLKCFNVKDIPENSVIMPQFNEMAIYCSEMATKRQENVKQRFVTGKNVLPFDLDTFIEVLDYLRICLWTSSGYTSVPGLNFNAQPMRSFILANFEDSSGIRKYISLIRQLVSVQRGYTTLCCLFDLLHAAPDILCKESEKLMPLLATSLKDVTEDTRTIVGQLYGILIAYNIQDQTEFSEEVQNLLNTSNKSLEGQHGSLLAASYGIYNRINYEKELNSKKKEDILEWKILKTSVEVLTKALSDSHPMIISASVRGLSFIGCVTELPIVDMGSDDSKESLLGILMGILKSNSVKQKLREEVCTCLSNLSHGDPKFFSQKILQEFLKLNKLTKDPALHIAIGQAIGSILGRQSVDVFQQDGDMKMDTDTCEDEELLKWLLKELYSLVKELHPSSRQALAIWLLATVKAGSRGNTVQENREILQMIFTELLSENNELVQDVASRGLGVIFSLSNKMDQKDLANELLLQLTGGQRKMMQVTGESKIFEEGVLGKTPTGENITTYRELCSLASDLNKPDLIYQFMQLANHNATWNSKLGAAFGLKSIAGLAKEDMEPFLGKIVPRLFRYKYDPTPKIQNSMVSIWNSLVSNPKEIVEQFYWEILQEVTTHLTNNEWRTRMSCCLAVRDLIKLPGYLKLRNGDTDTETELVELWNQLFRVMDDIHEGTRLAAEGTATVLSKSCIVACSPGHGKSGIRVVKSILPLFLEKGITNVVPEVRKISIRTLSDIIDSAGDSIAPHLVLLIPCLLQATGEVEIEKLSYMSTRFGDQSEVQEVVDTMRAEVAKQHHTMVAIGKCIRFITTDILEKVTPGIVDLIKTSVNLGTKVACAHFICQISVRLGKDMTPISSKYLSACYYGVSDRNPTVRKYFASAIGHLSGILRESSLVKLFTKLTDFYNDRQSYKCQAVPAILQSINKRYPDTLKDYGGQALPLIFFAMHDETDQAASEVWKDLWNDVSPGESGIRMHLDNIMPNLLKFLEDSSWTLKSQSGNAIKTLAKQLGKSLGGAEREILIKALVTALAGRTFQGKEKLLNALEHLCEHLESTTGELETLVVDAVMRECRKEEPVYRTHSLKALGNILDALKIDRFEEVYNMVWNILEHTSIIGDEDTVGGVVSAEERNKALQVNIALKESVCEILGKAWPVNSAETQQKYQVMFAQKCVECLNRNTRPVQVSLLAALGRFVERLKILESPTVSVESPMECDKAVKKAKVESNAETTETICKIVLRCIGQVAEIPHTGLKKESLNILLIMINRLKKINDTIVLLMIKEHFAGTIDFFRRDNSPEIKCRVKDIEEKLRDV
ncbi:proteasome-associated protein ECM29 homolog [Lutzomyia longipalpis]|uniref:proteasome-associated protein ECM29 homolog n=1 Tax=Lutzomyia longipalpis TaxID=7200 RepID=UPI0024835C53|nr:proteasome-associated protein ECM29 homolog [Lutzomyia longipalpis]XP_055694623.1 proteasome-associated protein ECM29 homolog [Lutzomyia longipalpis]